MVNKNGDIQAATLRVIEMLVHNVQPTVQHGIVEGYSSTKILEEWDKLRGSDWFKQ